MEWSLEQENALDLSNRFLHSEDPWLYIGGFAGVGKTTLAKHLAATSGLRVLFAAYTGKAAYVMRQKGCSNAKTIHSLIYRHAGESKSDALREIEEKILKIKTIGLLEESKEELTEIEKKELERLENQRKHILLNEKRKPMFTLNPNSELADADLLIIDECSMVDEVMGNDLLSFEVPIIVLGDPMQLPPVGSGGFFTNRKPDILLTEIHRQAKESGILRLATDIRLTNGFSRVDGYYGSECTIRRKHDFEDLTQRVLLADQILVGKNDTRHRCNQRHRELSGRTGPVPVPGDKIVCLRNNHKAGLLNGSLWRVHESIHDPESMTVAMTISSEEDGASGIEVNSWHHHFIGQEDELKLQGWGRRDYEEFDYGDALTVHKAQGSQWDRVALFNESYCFRGTSQRWLYTGVTRAAKMLDVIL